MELVDTPAYHPEDQADEAMEERKGSQQSDEEI
jgi:hypothetical protein